jgi:N utilization substance protein B
MPRENSPYLRTKARALALQALYEHDVAGHPSPDSLKRLKEESGTLGASADYARELTDGVIREREGIDSWIHKYALAWPVRQLAVVDRNILRLALFELRYGRGVPSKVAINEAVELAKTFGGESSPRFVNGVLGSFMDEFESDPSPSPELGLSVAGNKCEEGK